MKVSLFTQFFSDTGGGSEVHKHENPFLSCCFKVFSKQKFSKDTRTIFVTDLKDDHGT